MVFICFYEKRKQGERYRKKADAEDKYYTPAVSEKTRYIEKTRITPQEMYQGAICLLEDSKEGHVHVQFLNEFFIS